MSSSTPFLPARSWDTVASPSCSPGEGDVRGFCSPCTPPSLSPAPLCDPSVLLNVAHLQPQPLFPAPKSLLPLCPVPQSCSQHAQGKHQCNSLVLPSTPKSHPNTSHWYHPSNPTSAHQIRPQVLPSTQTPIPSVPQHPQFPPPVAPSSSLPQTALPDVPHSQCSPEHAQSLLRPPPPRTPVSPGHR